MSSGQQAAGSRQQAGGTAIRCLLPAACCLLPALSLAAEPRAARERTVERLGVTARVRVEPGVVPITGAVTLTFSVEGTAPVTVEPLKLGDLPGWRVRGRVVGGGWPQLPRPAVLRGCYGTDDRRTRRASARGSQRGVGHIIRKMRPGEIRPRGIHAGGMGQGGRPIAGGTFDSADW